MRLLAHVSDLHFGTEDPVVVDALLEDLAAPVPDLVIVSGDLTQRARVSQYRAARAFLERLPAARLVIPGNHDVPLWNVARRTLSPHGRFRTLLEPALDPFFCDEEVAVLGLNTTRRFPTVSGRIGAEQLAAIRLRLGGAPPGRIRILVTHHPFIPPPAQPDAPLVGRAAGALRAAADAEVDLLLAGHLHLSYGGDVRLVHPAAGRSMLVAQAATALSRRTRGEPNGYNRIELDGDAITVHVRVFGEGRFSPLRSARWVRGASAWEQLPG